MSAAPKLSDERVREILGQAIDRREADALAGERQPIVGRLGGLRDAEEELTVAEVEAIAQAVIDLRTANGLLESRIEELEAENCCQILAGKR